MSRSPGLHSYGPAIVWNLRTGDPTTSSPRLSLQPPTICPDGRPRADRGVGVVAGPVLLLTETPTHDHPLAHPHRGGHPARRRLGRGTLALRPDGEAGQPQTAPRALQARRAHRPAGDTGRPVSPHARGLQGDQSHPSPGVRRGIPPEQEGARADAFGARRGCDAGRAHCRDGLVAAHHRRRSLADPIWRATAGQGDAGRCDDGLPYPAGLARRPRPRRKGGIPAHVAKAGTGTEPPAGRPTQATA